LRPSPAPLSACFDLTRHNTLGLVSHARFGGRLSKVPQIAEAVAFVRQAGLPFHMLGGGSNVVLAPDVRAVVGLMHLRGRRILELPDSFRVTARAGEPWDDLVRWTVAQGVGGLENLAGIPGTVGAAPVQTIGAYGVDLSDVFEALVAIDTTTACNVRFARSDCAFGYRRSRFKAEPGRYIVLEVSLLLPRPWQAVRSYPGLRTLPERSDPADVMQAVLTRRESRIPDWRVTGNAGFFYQSGRVRSVCRHMPNDAGASRRRRRETLGRLAA
jgi:UDP-N-acetylmuramate dehydrogenase|tara:strand:+ start:489 stop:1301 length:813 start_codon:yes stop_codon:yes gene_type:complete